MTTTGSSEARGARISRAEAERLRRDADLLGLTPRADVVRAGLDVLGRSAAEERMARGVDDFCGGEVPPAPVGVGRRHRRDEPSAP